jgi:hypothetical protein
MRPTSRTALVAAVCAGLVTLAGCGSDTSEPDPAGTPTVPATATSTTTTDPPASASPTTAPATASPPAPVTRTVVTMPISGCDDCTVTAWSSNRSEPVSLGARKVADGVPRWSVPVNRTRGMAFTVTTPDGLGTSNARTVVVIAYRDRSPGQEVSSRQAAAADQGSFCWAGTTAARASLRASVERFDDTVLGEARQSLRAYISPTGRALAPYTATFRGGMGVQDGPFCIT